jgi:type VI secretion system secreted protein VgrG
MTQSVLSAERGRSELAHERAEYRFDCPDLPDVFHVLELEATEALNEPYWWKIRARADHEDIDGFALLGRDVSLCIQTRSSERWFRGIADSVAVSQDAHGLDHCTIVVVPALFALSRTVDTRIFQDKTALEIVEEVLTEKLRPYDRSFESRVDASRLRRRSYCVQYRESDLDFVHRLLEEEGIGYYFRHEEHQETLVLFDDNRALPSLPRTIQLGSGESGAEGPWERLIWFPATRRRTSNAVTTRDFDWRRGARGKLEQRSAWGEGADRRRHEVYEHGVDHHHVIEEDTSALVAMAEAVVTSSIGRMPPPLADRALDLKGSVFDSFSASNTDDRARVRREWHERDTQVHEGISFATGLAAGTVFEVAGHTRTELDGGYFVTRVTHSSESGAQGAEVVSDHLRHLRYHNRIVCLPRARAWRPDRKTAKPRVDGVQTATVTGPPGMDVYTDAFGRVRAQFHWDRAEPELSGHYTCWLRVSQAWAGATAPAFLFVPRVGMEVLVTFVDGDPDRPVVIGCVYNGDNATPALLPAQATKSVIRTRSIPHGVGHNELSFEDARGMERVYVRAERDFSVLVQNDHDRRVNRHEQVSIGGMRAEHIELDEYLRIGGDYERSVAGRTLEQTMGDHTHFVGGNTQASVMGDHYVEAGGTISSRTERGEWIADGRGVTLRAGESAIRLTDDERLKGFDKPKGLTLQSFGSLIHLTQDRIELTVGSSSLVITPELIQLNGKTLPATGGATETEDP